ncbi:MAG: hypothetical protein KBC36_07770 [Spirochaetia bacterium]|nr:hypothetical protein [Spirochaetia bacterium]
MKRTWKLAAAALAATLALGACTPAVDPTPDPTWEPGFGIFSDTRETAAFLTEANAGTGTVTAGVVADAAAALEGNNYLGVDYQQSDWGGFFYKMATPADVSSYADGLLVFSIDVSGMTGLDYLEVKVASGAYPTEAGGVVDLFTLTPSSTDGAWETYEIPLASFRSLGSLPAWNALTTFAGFWNPQASGVAANGILKLDDIHFVEMNDLAVSTLAAPALNLVVGGSTGSPVVTATYANGATAIVDVSALAGWASDDEAVATVTGGVVGAVGAGVATITGTFGGQTLSLTVNVTETLVELGVYSETYAETGAPSIATSNTWGTSNMLTVTDPSTGEVTAVDGTEVLKVVATGGDWGGFVFQYAAGGLDVSGYTSLVFSVNASAFATFADLGVKIETDGGGASTQIQTATLTGSTSGDWITFEIPLTSYSAVDLTKINNIGFWNANDSGVTNPAYTLYFDNIYFKP